MQPPPLFHSIWPHVVLSFCAAAGAVLGLAVAANARCAERGRGVAPRTPDLLGGGVAGAIFGGVLGVFFFPVTLIIVAATGLYLPLRYVVAALVADVRLLRSAPAPVPPSSEEDTVAKRIEAATAALEQDYQREFEAKRAEIEKRVAAVEKERDRQIADVRASDGDPDVIESEVEFIRTEFQKRIDDLRGGLS